MVCLKGSFDVSKYFEYQDVTKLSVSCNLAKGGIWVSPHQLRGTTRCPIFWGLIPHLGNVSLCIFPSFPQKGDVGKRFPKSFSVLGMWGSFGARTPPQGTRPCGIVIFFTTKQGFDLIFQQQYEDFWLVASPFFYNYRTRVSKPNFSSTYSSLFPGDITFLVIAMILSNILETFGWSHHFYVIAKLGFLDLNFLEQFLGLFGQWHCPKGYGTNISTSFFYKYPGYFLLEALPSRLQI